MEWQWPASLWLLGLLPLCAAAYGWVLRRRRKYAVRYASLALVREALPPDWGRRRHVPFGLWLLGLGSLVGAVGRPVAAVPMASGRATIMLVMDVSLSMCSTDIAPTRLKAAQRAAQSFILHQPPATQIGLVALASFGALVQAPTTEQPLLLAAVRDLETGLGTAIGSGIATALEAIEEQRPAAAPGTISTTRPAGVYAPEIIVLLTDGVATVGEPPLEAAARAAARGVRVYTISFGTPNGTFSSCFADKNNARSAEQQIGWYQSPGAYHEGVDVATLKEIAAMTGGHYYAATSAGELQAVLDGLPAAMVTQVAWKEVTVLFAAVGVALALAAMVLGMRWNGLM